MRYIKLAAVCEAMLLSAVEFHPRAYVRRKSQMLLSSHRGLSVPQIAQSHGVGLRHVYRLFNSWESQGLLGLYISAGRGSKSAIDWSSESATRLLETHTAAHPQNLSKVAAEMSRDTGKTISKRMVQRNLKKKNIVGSECARV